MVDERPEEPAEGEGDPNQAEAADSAPVAEDDDEGSAIVEGDPAAPAGEDAGVTELAAELEAAKDAALRAQADAMNVQRRAEQEIEKARKFALF
jgi:molecular chaperone GrpE